MGRGSADALCEQVEALLPDHEVTTAPWEEPEVHPGTEWVVTIWWDGDVLLDVFEVGDAYVAREVGLGPVVGRAATAEGIAALVRQATA